MVDYTPERRPKTHALPHLSIFIRRSVSDIETGEWVVNSLSIDVGEYKHEIRFKSDQDIDEILCPELISSLAHYLPQQSEPTIYTGRSFFLKLQNAVLSGISITADVVRHGIQTAMISFKNYVGDFNSLFKIGKAPEFYREAINTVSMNTISNILLPVLSLSALRMEDLMKLPSDTDKQNQIRQALQKIHVERELLEFYTCLLTTFISDQSRGKPVFARVSSRQEIASN